MPRILDVKPIKGERLTRFLNQYWEDDRIRDFAVARFSFRTPLASVFAMGHLVARRHSEPCFRAVNGDEELYFVAMSERELFEQLQSVLED